MADLPFIKFYPSDWLGSTKLRGVSLAAKGVWIDLLAIMWECTPRGTLTVAGRPMTVQEAAARVHGPTKAVVKALEELIAQGVADRRPDGTIYSARMVKDAAIHEVRAYAGSLGGRATLGPKQTTISVRTLLDQMPKQTPKQTDSKSQDFAQPSEIRVQKPETRAAAESTGTAAAAGLSMEQAEIRTILLGAGVSDPTLAELIGIGVPVAKVRTIVAHAKAAGKGAGVVVLDVRAAAASHQAIAAATTATRATRDVWAIVWGSLSREQRWEARDAFMAERPGMNQYTGGAIEDLPSFQEWHMHRIRMERAGAGAP